MAENPYISPTTGEKNAQARPVNYFFRALAIGLWVFAVFLGMSCYPALSVGNSVEYRTEDPVLF